MRFAYLCCDFGVHLFGTQGAAVHVQETVSALRRRGHEVRVFSPSVNGEPDEARREGVHHVPLDGFAAEAVRLLFREDGNLPPHLAKEVRALLYAEYAQRALAPALAEYEPDAIYERFPLFVYAGAELARSLRVPLLLELNAPLAVEQARYRELVLRATAEELERRVLTGADALVVVSTALAEYARDLGVPAERITVLPNGVDVDRFHPDVSGEAIRTRYGLEDKHVIGFAGSLKAWHDLHTLLAAVELLAEEDPSVHLLVVGAGPRLAELERLTAPHLTCTGGVAHRDVPPFLAAMDVVVVPYPAGGDTYFSPVKLFEAMAMARPAVGARIGQVAELLVDGETGVLYEPGDSRDLAAKIGRVRELPDQGAALGAAGREWVAATRTWDHNARRIEAIARSSAGMAGVR